jgi:hypothetical protein
MNKLETAKIMYEIYQEGGYNRSFRVIYFTELSEHNREIEINRAMAGRHVHDGFIQEWKKDQAKSLIEEFVGRLNSGQSPAPEELEEALGKLH